MADFSEAIKSGLRSALCQVLSVNEQAAALVNRLTPGDFLENLEFPALLSRLACNRDMPSAPPPPPFTGGQCCDTAYQVFYNFSLQNIDTGTVRGPFSSNNFLNLGKVVSFGPEGTPSVLKATTQTCAGATTTQVLGNMGNSNEIAVGFAVTAVTPYDGAGLNNCGDPQPTLPTLPPNWNTGTTNITYTNQDGLDVTVPVIAAFGYARVDIDANVTVPITVDVGGINFKAEFNFNTGDIQFFPRNNYYGSPRDGEDPTDFVPLPDIDLPDYPPSLPPSAPIVDEGEEEGEEVIVGVVVTVTSVDSGQVGTLYQSDNPDISIPNLGNVSFLCRVGRLDGAWTTDIPVKNRRQLIPCPWEGGAITVGGTPRPGVEWVLTPLRSRKRVPFEYPETV